MSRKTYWAGVTATAATFVFTLLAAEGQGVAAEQDEETPAEVQAMADVHAPQFVAHEVVQPLPQPPASDTGAKGEPIAASLGELVSSVSVKSDMPPDLQCVAQAVYFEARGEPLDGQLAVAEVIINRAASRHFPDSYCSVVKQRAQFSFVKNGQIPAVRPSRAWQRAQAIATIANEGLWESEAQDALYFHAAHVNPRWASKKSALAMIDSHIFYR